jgi:hypothetical protein
MSKYSNISFSPPDGVRSAAKRGLELHEKGLSGNGLEAATVAWARKYVSGDSVSPERARMGNRFFGRNARFANAPKDSPAWVSWLLWGGGAGKAWFASLVRQMDNADKKSTSTALPGKLKLAEADVNNPLLRKIELILTDFEPNANNEGIPVEEKDNIIKTALNMPIKIAMSESSYGGHANAVPIGPITRVYEDNHEGRDVIKAEAMIWGDEFSDVYTLLKSVAEEREYIGTSWEVYYSASDEKEGVNWLRNVTFAGTCIVDTPAYGNRTKLLKVAEKQKMEELQKEIELLKASLAEKENEINGLREQNEAYKEADERRSEAERRQNVINRLIQAGFTQSEAEEKVEFYVKMDDDSLEFVIKDFASKRTQASNKTQDVDIIPEPRLGQNGYDVNAIVKALKNLKKG